LLIPFAREARLEAVGGVVEAGMQHAAVAAARMLTPRRLLLEQGDGGARMAAAQLAGQGDADDATADD
jgi:hypothetical protein